MIKTSFRHGTIVATPTSDPICRRHDGTCENYETLQIAVRREKQDDTILVPISWELAAAFHDKALTRALNAVRPQPIPRCQP